jgi:copper oxidase (laccase) domain-containing protein
MSERIAKSVGVADSSPTRLKDVQYLAPGIGILPSFAELPVRHGFTWGASSDNMAYKQHLGDPSIITQRNERAFQTLGMSPVREAVVMEDLVMVYCDITPAYLKSKQITERGIFTSAHAVFTTLPEVPLVVKPGDCTVSLIYGVSQDQEPVIGMIHSGRNELGSEIPTKAINHLQETYGCDPTNVKVGILPSLGVENHLIRAEDTEKVIGETTIWDNYMNTSPNGDIYLDGPKLLVSQLKKSGIPGRNIELYDIDTYDAAKQGQSFSHRYATDTQTSDRMGRFLIAIELER